MWYVFIYKYRFGRIAENVSPPHTQQHRVQLYRLPAIFNRPCNEAIWEPVYRTTNGPSARQAALELLEERLMSEELQVRLGSAAIMLRADAVAACQDGVKIKLGSHFSYAGYDVEQH